MHVRAASLAWASRRLTAGESRFIDRNAPFVGVEFRLPGDPEAAQLCVLCSRRLTQKLFYDM